MAFTHPRRTAKTNSSDMPLSRSALASLDSAIKIAKSATFHSPQSISHYDSCIPSLPRRSETSLDEVVDAHKRRAELTLEDINCTFAGLSIGSPQVTGQSFMDDGFPDMGTLNNTVVLPRAANRDISNTLIAEECMTSNDDSRSYRLKRTNTISKNKREDSDSENLSCSSLSSTSTAATSVASDYKRDTLVDQSSTTSNQNIMNINAKTSSGSSLASTLNVQSSIKSRLSTRLSIRAKNKIHEHILRPLLAESSFIDFHQLLEDCPSKIHRKEITCLRDLERTLLLAAPKLASSAQLYLDFSLSTVHVLQATVEFLSEPDLVQPADRPYTGGYFVDLVDQLKNYAHQVHTSRTTEAKEELLKTSRTPSSGEIKLYGGLSRNGRPAELVRITDGKAYSLATGLQIPMEDIEADDTTQSTMKRSLNIEKDDDSVLRSMARRKGSSMAKLPRQCSEPGCDKTYMRDCDLSKHQKTHSRPWKCPHVSCKFHENGWPTEKEMSRHLNDKHNPNPKLFKCLYPPCDYESRRDSNRKQHMEKQHGYVYERVKELGVRKPHKRHSSSRSDSDRSVATPRRLRKGKSRAQLTPVTDAGVTPNSDSFYPTPEFNRDEEMPIELPTPRPEQEDEDEGPLVMTTPEYNQDVRFPVEPPSPVSNIDYPTGERDMEDAQMTDAETFMSSPYSVEGSTDIVTANYGHNDFVLYDEDIYSARAQMPDYPSALPAEFTTMAGLSNKGIYPNDWIFANGYANDMDFVAPTASRTMVMDIATGFQIPSAPCCSTCACHAQISPLSTESPPFDSNMEPGLLFFDHVAHEDASSAITKTDVMLTPELTADFDLFIEHDEPLGTIVPSQLDKHKHEAGDDDDLELNRWLKDLKAENELLSRQYMQYAYIENN